MKRLLAPLLAVLLCGCSAKSTLASKMQGRWKDRDGREIELFSDGKLWMKGNGRTMSGKWEVVGENRAKIITTNPLGVETIEIMDDISATSETLGFNLDGTSLTMERW